MPIKRDAQDLIEGVVVDLVDVAVEAAADVVGRDRVVHQRGERPEALDRRGHRARHLLLDAVVGLQVHRATAGVVDPGLDRAAGVLRSAGEGDRRALRRQHLDDSLTDAPGAAGDQRHLAVEPHASPPGRYETIPYSFI